MLNCPAKIGLNFEVQVFSFYVLKQKNKNIYSFFLNFTTFKLQKINSSSKFMFLCISFKIKSKTNFKILMLKIKKNTCTAYVQVQFFQTSKLITFSTISSYFPMFFLWFQEPFSKQRLPIGYSLRHTTSM